MSRPTPQRRGPTWDQRHRLGVLMSRHMEPVRTLEDMAAELGSTKQRLYHETVVALGSLAWRLCWHYGIDPNAITEDGDPACSAALERVYCGVDGVPLHADHVLAFSRGGASTMENLATACGDCNVSKGAKPVMEWLDR